MPAVMEAIAKMTKAEKVDILNYLLGDVASSGEMFVPLQHVAYFGKTKNYEREHSRARSELMDIPKRWIRNPELDKSLDDMRTIDEELWK